METFVGCQRGSVASAIEEECRVVAYESCGCASSSAAANPIKPEPSDEACDPEIRGGPRGFNPHTEDRTSPKEADGKVGGAAWPSTSDGSGRQRAKCEHGRQKSRCRECGGIGVCPHGREKRICKECGGSAICPHGREKRRCKECGGSAICPHGREKSKCKECGGSAFCPHGRIKSTCKACGGSAICPHGREKRWCKECGGSAICPHGRQKPQCKDCGGSAICPHGRQKYSCKACGGSAFCPHGRIKRTCKECGGSALCVHGRRKYRCKACGGSAIELEGSAPGGLTNGTVDVPAVGAGFDDGGPETPHAGNGICPHGTPREKRTSEECPVATTPLPTDNPTPRISLAANIALVLARATERLTAPGRHAGNRS